MVFKKGNIPWNEGLPKEEILKHLKNGNVWNKGKHPFSEKAKEMMSEARKKLWKNPEYRKKVSETLKRLYREGKLINLNKGKIFSIETRKKMSEAGKLKIGPKNPFYGKHHTEETKNKIRLKVKGKKCPKISETRKRLFKEGKLLRRMGELNPMFGKKHPKERIELYRKKAKELWKNKEYVRKISKSLKLKPNKLERKWIRIFRKHNLPYKYVGSFEFVIGGKCPDFINVNGKKICLEIRSKNVCRHYQNIEPEDYEKQRKEHFKQYGWDCEIIWGK